MGTRSTIHFHDDWKNTTILSVYQQFDGYYEGVGLELARWLADKKIINGFCDETMEEGYANGMGCLTAQFVATFKTRIGGFYITNPDDRQEFNYFVSYKDRQFIIEVNDFKGTPQEFINQYSR